MRSGIESDRDRREILEEYKDISENLRTKHKIIWQIRVAYMLTLAAFVTYAATPDRQLPKHYVILFLIFTTLLIIIFDIRYQRTKYRLEKRIVEVEETLGTLKQYSYITHRRIPEWFQVMVVYIIWIAGVCTWFITI